MASYLMLSRSFFEHDFWKEKRVFSRGEAWIDLIRSAAWKPHERMIGNTLVLVPRGAFIGSERFLSQRWVWSTKKVRGFIDMLKKGSMIEVETKRFGNQITLCNFDTYNTPENPEEAPKKRNGAQPRSVQEAGRKREGSNPEASRKQREEGYNVQEGKDGYTDNNTISPSASPNGADPRFQPMIEAYCEEFEKANGRKYVMIGGRDGAALKKFLAACKSSVESLTETIAASFDRSKADRFAKQCARGSTLQGFCVAYNDIVAELARGSTTKSAREKANEEAVRYGGGYTPEIIEAMRLTGEYPESELRMG